MERVLGLPVAYLASGICQFVRAGIALIRVKQQRLVHTLRHTFATDALTRAHRHMPKST